MAVRNEEVIERGTVVLPVTMDIGVVDANGSIWVPLDKLKDSPKNVRTVPHTEAHIKSLAALIHANRQMYPCVVEAEIGESGEPTGFYLVTAGKGRRLAQLERVEQEQIPPDHPIWCLLDSADRAREMSIADNVQAPMHPADAFAAFKALIDEGQPIEDVAARFGVTPLVVQRRLKLANVAPEFIEMFRKNELTLEHMMAFAITEDHEKQRATWAAIPKHNRSASLLREALVADEASISSARAKFVGVSVYEQAGGPIRRDLFSDKDQGYIVDMQLLTRLAGEKLQKAAEKLQKKEHLAWVEPRLQFDYADSQAFGEVDTVRRAYTEEEAKRLAAIKVQRSSLETAVKALESGDERLDRLSETIEALAEEESQIAESLHVTDPEQAKFAGAIVTIGENGKLSIERGLLRPEDQQRFAKQKKTTKKNGKGDKLKQKGAHSAALVRELTAHRTLALQVALCQRPDVALVLLTHRLVTETFVAGGESPAQISAEQPVLERFAEDIKQAKAYKVLKDRKAELKSILPRKSESLLGWLLEKPQSEVLDLFAFCVAVTLNCVQADEQAPFTDALAKSVNLDMCEWWTATAANYFGRVSKARMMQVVREAASSEAAAALQLLKRKSAATLAEERVAGSGWLPELLRTPAT